MTHGRIRLRPAALLELGLLATAAALGWILVPLATDRWLERLWSLSPSGARDPDGVRSAARLACLLFSAGIAALAAGRVVEHRRAPGSVGAPLVLPAAAFASLLGLVLHAATAGGAVEFAQGFLVGALAAAVVLALAIDPAEIARRVQVPLLVAITLTLAALAVAGSGPGESGTRINLGPVQPLEAVKLAVVAFLAAYLGARAAKLRWQRGRVLLIRWPRPVLLFPALASLAASFAGMYLVGDLGPTLILALVFLGMFYLATRAAGWVVAAFALVALILIAVSIWPGLAGGGHLATRLAMWRDPWQNGLSHGHQVGEGLWAIAAGGFSGQGLAQAHLPLPPAAMTDLALAVLVEQTGVVGLAAYLALIGVLVLSGLHVAARNRTPERILLAAGLSLLLLVQWGIIHAGTFGILPLTGVVVPFVSGGRSSMIAFLVAAAIVARLAEGGRERAPSVELDELRRGVVALAVVAGIVLVAALVDGTAVAVVRSEEIASRGIVIRLRDGTVVHRQNPRLLELAGAIRRGAIEDRDGRPIAHSPRPSARAYPLGNAMGTLLGTWPSRVKLPSWALEARWDQRLRGYRERDDGPRYADFTGGAGDGRLPSPDLRPFAALLHLSATARRERIRQIDAAVASRSVRLSIDARLQVEVGHLLARHAAGSPVRAAAAVVLAVDTGQILARAQVPDLDPSDPAWQDALARGDREFTRRFWGVYGPGADRTGAIGVFQAGSVAKLATAVAAARTGWAAAGTGCQLRGEPRFACAERDAQGPLFDLQGWPQPVHDFSGDRVHGSIDVVDALAVSCNVYFAQLGLALGPEPFRALIADGVDLGYGSARHPFSPGAPGSRQLASTAFGQGAMAMNVLMAARLAAAIAGGGVYRKCPGTLELAATCEERRIVDDPSSLTPVLAGMRRVMTDGTGAQLERVAGVRVYGKTGTADTPRFRGEELYGSRAGEPPPHSWFVAVVEPEAAPECAPEAPGRIAIAVVVPRGGTGARRAGPIAIEIAGALARLGYLGEAR